jgi:SAM-dependent methyltransferase
VSPSLPRSYFEELYASKDDPWGFASSPYERNKYAQSLGALSRPRYGSGLEIGCSIGVLTRLIAERCDRLLAIDIADAPLEAARRRCSDQPQVMFACGNAPREWPEGAFDLIVLSEVIYYLDRDDLALLARRLSDSLSSEAEVLLIHWTGETNYPLSGDEAAALFLEQIANFTRIVRQERTDKFRLDLVGRL